MCHKAKGTRKVRFSFDETHPTHTGAMWLIQRFCNKLKLRWLIPKILAGTPPERGDEFLPKTRATGWLRLPREFRSCKWAIRLPRLEPYEKWSASRFFEDYLYY